MAIVEKMLKTMLKTMLKYFVSLKVMAVLERGDQELSIGGLISLITFCLVGWNFN